MKYINSKNIGLTIFVVILTTIMIWSITKKSAQPIGTLSLYINQDCPHCRNVEEFILENNLEDKYTIEYKDIYSNGQYTNELIARSQLCSIETEKIGVPLLYDSGECYMGEDQILAYFQKRM